MYGLYTESESDRKQQGERRKGEPMTMHHPCIIHTYEHAHAGPDQAATSSSKADIHLGGTRGSGLSMILLMESDPETSHRCCQGVRCCSSRLPLGCVRLLESFSRSFISCVLLALSAVLSTSYINISAEFTIIPGCIVVRKLLDGLFQSTLLTNLPSRCRQRLRARRAWRALNRWPLLSL